MNRIQFGEGACDKTRKYLDSYISNELLVETNHEVLRHIENCPACAAEVEARTQLRTRLRVAVKSQSVPPELQVRIREQIRSSRSSTWFVSGWFATGWPVGALLAGAGGWASPSLAGAKARRKAELGRLEALAVWAEQLRDTIGAAAGLQEAILATAKVAPLPIRAEVAELATRLRREPLSVALRRFAGSLADPAADQIVAALALASERQAGNLVGLLSEVASAARQQVSMRLRIETGRARTYTQTMSVALITGGSVGLLVVMRSSYLDPYDTAVGQMVLAGVGLLFVVAAGC